MHPQRRNVYAGLLLFDTGKLEQVVNYLSEWFPTAGENEAILQLIITLPDGKVSCISSFDPTGSLVYELFKNIYKALAWYLYFL